MDIKTPANAGTYRYWTRTVTENGHITGFEIRRAKWADFAAQYEGQTGLVEVVETCPNMVTAKAAIARHAAADRA